MLAILASKFHQASGKFDKTASQCGLIRSDSPVTFATKPRQNLALEPCRTNLYTEKTLKIGICLLEIVAIAKLTSKLASSSFQVDFAD